MSSSTISFKRHNHRLYPCETPRKQELLKHLLSLHEDKSILIISADNTATTEIEDKNITLSNDAGLAQMPDRKWDILISFEVPSDAENYVKRLSCATQMALLIADEMKEKTLLYPIEALLERTIARETLSGFEPKVVAVRHEARHRPTASQQREAEKNPPKSGASDKKPSQRNHRYDGTARTESEKRKDGKSQYKKPYDKNSAEKKPWDKNKGEKKPYDRKPSTSNDYRNKSKDNAASGSQKPKRAPRVIKVPSKKPDKES